ncbi:MAG: DNA polymerase III subunit alpha, partial [Bacteroidota bacterium]
YQRGDTIGTFQFESEGMRMYLKELKPTVIEDLIAMNALYRPGPMQFIDSFIRRKHGTETVEFPHELLEDILKPTYGIMVYQEQIMQTAQILAGYSLGQADLLRRAMGKKKMDVMQQQREVFVKGAQELHSIAEEKSDEVFEVMMKFAQYGFNRSHSAAYSVVAFQTAYLKANYPAEYMASVLTHNMSDIKKVTFFMEECTRMDIPVLGPDVNESVYKFAVNKKGEIRFGLGAVKGVGEGAVDSIVDERTEGGTYLSIFDLTKRINLRSANRKAMESLVLAGAFDSFEGINRAQYLHQEREGGPVPLELAIKFGAMFQDQQNSSQQSLFGEHTDAELPEPQIPACPPWNRLEELAREKEVTGIYLSGHPLDDYRLEIEHFCNVSITELKEFEKVLGRELAFAGILTDVQHRFTKTGKPFGVFSIEDFSDSLQVYLFSQDYIDLKKYLVKDWFVFVKGKVQPRKFGDGQLELKVHKMELLSEVRERMAKTITLKVPVNDVSDDLVDKISALMDTYAGKCRLTMLVGDPLENVWVTMPSRKPGVDLSNAFIAELNRSNIQFKLNQ